MDSIASNQRNDGLKTIRRGTSNAEAKVEHLILTESINKGKSEQFGKTSMQLNLLNLINKDGMKQGSFIYLDKSLTVHYDVHQIGERAINFPKLSNVTISRAKFASRPRPPMSTPMSLYSREAWASTEHSSLSRTHICHGGRGPKLYQRRSLNE